MANQYTSSFKHVVQEKFGKSAKELLIQYAEENATYQEIGKITGFSVGTIRKWCNLYQISLQSKTSNKIKKPIKDCSLLANKDIFKTKTMNVKNILSRRWSKLKYIKAIY